VRADGLCRICVAGRETIRDRVQLPVEEDLGSCPSL
jgi:hypothetical protein